MAAILYQELAGEKPMSTQRVGAPQKMLAEGMPIKERFSKRGRPSGASGALSASRLGEPVGSREKLSLPVGGVLDFTQLR